MRRNTTSMATGPPPSQPRPLAINPRTISSFASLAPTASTATATNTAPIVLKTHERTTLVRMLNDNTLQRPRFYIITLLVFLFVLLVLYPYAISLHLDGSTLELSPEAIALLVLGAGVVIAIPWTLFRFSGDIPLEYALFGAAIWLAYTAITQDSCLCCTALSTSFAERHDHGDGGAPSALDALNHRLIGSSDGQVGASASCTNPWLVYGIHNAIVTLLLLLLYIGIFLDRDYFRRVQSAYLTMQEAKRAAYRRQQARITDATGDVELEEVSTPESGRTYWVRTGLLFLLLIAVAIPLAGNSPVRYSIELLLGRILIATVLVLMRFVNTYLMRYTHIKTSSVHALLLQHPSSAFNVDPRFTHDGVHLLDADGNSVAPTIETTPWLFVTPSSSPSTDNTIADDNGPIASQELEQHVRSSIQRSWILQCCIDVTLASLAYIWCEWFLFVSLLQFLFEIILLATETHQLALLWKALAQIVQASSIVPALAFPTLPLPRIAPLAPSSSIVPRTLEKKTFHPPVQYKVATALPPR